MPTTKTTRRRAASPIDMGDDDFDSMPAPAKKAPAKRAPAARKPAAPRKAPAKKAPAKAAAKKNTGAFVDSDEDDLIMLDEEQEPAPKAQPKRAAASRASAAPSQRVGRQTQLNFSQAPSQRASATSAPRVTAASRGKAKAELSDDVISSDDDDDAFEPVASNARSGGRRR